MKRVVRFFVLFLSVLFLPIIVNAASLKSEGQVCVDFGNGGVFYKITNRGSKVKGFEALITKEDIGGSMQYPQGCFCSKDKNCIDEKGMCKKDYRFTAQNQGLSCVVDSTGDDGSYTFYVCPSDESFSVVNTMFKGKSNNKDSGMKTEFDPNSGLYHLIFDFNGIEGFKGHVYAQSIKKRINEDGKSVFDINAVSGTPASQNSIERVYSSQEVENGLYFAPGSEYYLIFYLDLPNDACNGQRIGYVQSVVQSKVPSPVYSTEMCTSFRTKYSNSSVEKAMVPYCFEEKIEYAEYTKAIQETPIAIAQAEAYVSRKVNQPLTNNDFTCLFENVSSDVNKKIAISTKSDWLFENATYWNAFCTETLSLEYDDPQAVKAGLGVAYNTKITLSRSCEPVKISEPKYYPKCEFGITCWGGPANHHGEAGAGPNEEFDTCVKECDGGKYTQSCIDACYKSTYESNSSVYKPLNAVYNTVNANFLDSANQSSMVKRIAFFMGDKIASDPAGNPTSSECVINSNHYSGCGVVCNGSTQCTSEHGVTFTYLDGCNANGQSSGTKCYEVYKNYKCAGLTDEEAMAIYKSKIADANDEYNKVVNAITLYSEDAKTSEEYRMQFDEEYDLQTNGKYKSKKTVFDNISNNTIGKTDKEQKKILSTNVIALDSVWYNLPNPVVINGVTIYKDKEVPAVNITRTINLSAGKSYVNRYDGNNVVYNKTKFQTDDKLDKDKRYYAGVNKYFTRLDTKFVNDYSNWPYYNHNVNSDSTESYDKNIFVRIKNIGTWNQWGKNNGINVECLYGTDQGIVDNGIRYIFRPVELTDLFPNGRSPRFNWTGSVDKVNNTATGSAKTADKSYYGSEIDPEALIETVESKGSSIYKANSGEVDYEFVITRENIKNIRKYNKNVSDYNGDNSRNYLDYNMECVTNSRNQEVCYSKFLDNINGNGGSESGSNFITYSEGSYTKERRKSIIGCNNTKNSGTECDVITH